MLAKGLQRILDIRCTLPHPLHGWRPTRVPLKIFEVGKQAVNGLWTGCELTKSPNLKICWQVMANTRVGARGCLLQNKSDQKKQMYANVHYFIHWFHCFQVSRSLWILLPLLPISIRIPGCQLVKATSINILIGNHRKSSKIIESKVLLVVFGGASPETSCRTAMRAFRAWIVHF